MKTIELNAVRMGLLDIAINFDENFRFDFSLLKYKFILKLDFGGNAIWEKLLLKNYLAIN